jgi:hypothetical protein
MDLSKKYVFDKYILLFIRFHCCNNFNNNKLLTILLFYYITLLRLEEVGYGVGQRIVELTGVRDRATRRETKLVNMLQHITTVIWKQLFGKAADSLERSTENENECMLLPLALAPE